MQRQAGACWDGLCGGVRGLELESARLNLSIEFTRERRVAMRQGVVEIEAAFGRDRIETVAHQICLTILEGAGGFNGRLDADEERARIAKDISREFSHISPETLAKELETVTAASAEAGIGATSGSGSSDFVASALAAVAFVCFSISRHF